MSKFKTQLIAKAKIISDITSEDAKRAEAASDHLGISNEKQPDLMYMEDIFVSTGSNLNDDIFLPEELIKAVVDRNTIPLKPVNIEHQQESIIGVMYDSFISDKAGNKIDGPDFPKDFDVISRSVIWQSIFPAIAKEIEQGAANDSLFVSMETFFNNYDYAVGFVIVERNENTSFLDSALKINGGPGEFQGERVRRVLRDMTFGGKGIVKDPANPESIIKSVAKEEKENLIDELKNKIIPKNAVIGSLKSESSDDIEGSTQDITGNQRDQEEEVSEGIFDNKQKRDVPATDQVTRQIGDDMSEKLVKELEAKLDSVIAERDEFKAKVAEMESTGAEQKIKELKTQNDTNILKIEELESDLAKQSEMSKELGEAKSELEVVKARIIELEAEKAEQEALERLVARKNAVLEIVKLNEEEFDSIASDIKDLPDEDFEKYLDRCKLFTSKAVTANEETPSEEEKKDKENLEASASVDAKDKIDADVILDNVNEEENSINSDSDDNKDLVDQFKAHIGGLFFQEAK